MGLMYRAERRLRREINVIIIKKKFLVLAQNFTNNSRTYDEKFERLARGGSQR